VGLLSLGFYSLCGYGEVDDLGGDFIADGRGPIVDSPRASTTIPAVTSNGQARDYSGESKVK
jgi:hypothetical protein